MQSDQHAKKMLVILLAGIFIILGYVWLRAKNNPVQSQASESSSDETVEITENTPVVTITANNETQREPSRIDSDGDGLEDWEEVIWGLSPLKADTNEDGVSDRQTVIELKQERDRIANTRTLPGFTPPQEEPNNTDILIRDTYLALLSNANSGVQDNSDLERDLANNIIGLVKSKIYTEDDLVIVPGDKEIQIRSYLSGMGSIFNQFAITREEISALTNELRNYEVYETEFNSVDNIIAKETKAIGILTSSRVPTDAKQLHLNILNSRSFILSTLEALKSDPNDPLLALSGIVRIEEAFDQLVADYQNWSIGYYDQAIRWLENK